MKKILIGFVLLIIGITILPASSEQIQDKICYKGWLIPGILPLWICNNEDGSMDHSFLTYQSMVNFYTPIPMEMGYIPENTYEWTVSNLE